MNWLSTSCRRLIEAQRVGAYDDDQGKGIKTTHWFWGAADKLSQASNVTVGDPAQKTDISQDSPDADETLNSIVIDTPQISGATLINQMKVKGLKVVKAQEAWSKVVARFVFRPQLKETYFEGWSSRLRPFSKKKEADTSSSFPAVLVKTKEAQFKFQATNLKESASDDGIGPTRFKVVLLQEGLGNFGDAYYYSRDALNSAVPVFTGSKIFADHPSSAEEETRPERSVRDVLGHFENIAVETDKTNRAMLTGEVSVLPDKPFEWARALMRHAIEHAKKFPDQPFVGLSINASGDADEVGIDEVMKTASDSIRPKLIEAKEKGINVVKVVSKIKDAISCDLVTAAGAGGGIVSVIK